MSDVNVLANAHSDAVGPRFAQTIHTGHHELVADEPASVGGGDAGSSPYGLLLASLAACTAITLRMYADHKGWELGPLHIDLSIGRSADGIERITRTITPAPAVTTEQRAKLAEIAEKTPVTKTLKRSLEIATTFV